MRGEHPTSHARIVRGLGSSPHARGALIYEKQVDSAPGIIPACAGSTGRARGSRGPARDHPRMRGEHCPLRLADVERAGSSPHARGAPRSWHFWRAHPGIIPACAGSTSPSTGWRSWKRDHPRMRGEHRTGPCTRRPRRGSSPHARGAPSSTTGEGRGLGIIPACAGSTNIRRYENV